MEMGHKIAKMEYFLERWEHLDTDAWPGRELLWLWTHPLTAIVIVITFLGTLSLYLTGY